MFNRFLLIFILLFNTNLFSKEKDNIHFTVEFVENLEKLKVKICNNFKISQKFIPVLQASNMLIVESSKLENINGFFFLNSYECIKLKIDLRQANNYLDQFMTSVIKKNYLSFDPNTFVWLPESQNTRQIIYFEFIEKKNLSLLFPFEKLDHRYTYYGVYDKKFISAILSPNKVDRLTDSLEILYLDSLNNDVKDKIESTIISQHSYFNSFFKLKKKFIFLIDKNGLGREVIPIGLLIRSPINSIYLKVNQKKISKLNEDATIFHELSHSIMPFLEDTPIWFYEGLATFYENYYLKMNSKINYQERISFLKLNLQNPSSYSNKKNYYLGEAYFLMVEECIKKTKNSFHEVWKKKNNNVILAESENFTSLVSNLDFFYKENCFRKYVDKIDRNFQEFLSEFNDFSTTFIIE